MPPWWPSNNNSILKLSKAANQFLHQASLLCERAHGVNAHAASGTEGPSSTTMTWQRLGAANTSWLLCFDVTIGGECSPGKVHVPQFRCLWSTCTTFRQFRTCTRRKIKQTHFTNHLACGKRLRRKRSSNTFDSMVTGWGFIVTIFQAKLLIKWVCNNEVLLYCEMHCLLKHLIVCSFMTC